MTRKDYELIAAAIREQVERSQQNRRRIGPRQSEIRS